MQRQRIAVLGAGPMGLAVAYQLARDGHHTVLFEADNRVGGMTAVFDFNGLDIERYYHFHCTSDTAFLQMLDELHIADKMHWVETKMGFYHQGALHAWGNPVALLKFPGLSLVAKLRYGLHAFLATKRVDWRPPGSGAASAALGGHATTCFMKSWVTWMAAPTPCCRL
jgi:protoporphyrinogen oxidase